MLLRMLQSMVLGRFVSIKARETYRIISKSFKDEQTRWKKQECFCHLLRIDGMWRACSGTQVYCTHRPTIFVICQESPPISREVEASHPEVRCHA
jgi:hypothetical protein